MLVRVRKGRQPVKGVSLNYSCEQLSLMPLGNCGKSSHPTHGVRELGRVYPSSYQSLPGASPQAQMQTLALKDTRDVLKAKDRGRVGIITPCCASVFSPVYLG